MTDPPGLAPGVVPPRLGGVALPGREGRWDLALEGGRVAAVTPASGLASGLASAPGSGLLALPAFAEPHLHADRAYLGGQRRPASLDDAIAAVRQARARATWEDVAERAGRLLDRCSAHGVTRARTHVDVDAVVDLRALRAVCAVRAALRDRLDVEIVAFATAAGDPATQEGLARLGGALDAGADLLGGVASLFADPPRSLPALLGLAAERGVPVDVHVDETVATDGLQLERVVELAGDLGLQGRVTVSHCSALASLDAATAERVIGALAAARVTVVTLPALNLYLQDRTPGRTPRLRGVTLVSELVAAGVPVRFGTDNVRDAFYPYGDGDPLEAAFLAALGAHVDDEATLLAGICGGRRGVEAGDPADLVLVAADSLTDALARRPAGRTVLRAGRVVAAPPATTVTSRGGP